MTGIYKYIDEAGRDDLLDMRDAINKALRKFPGQKPKKEKPVDPAAQFRLDAHRLAKDWLNNNGFDAFQWDGLQNKGLNGLMDNIKCSLCKSNQFVTPEDVANTFARFMLALPPFWKESVDFATFHRKYNTIVQQIRNAKNGRQQIGSQSVAGADIVGQALQYLNGVAPCG